MILAIQDAVTALTQLDTKLTEVTYSIEEVEKDTAVMADFLDTANVSRTEIFRVVVWPHNTIKYDSILWNEIVMLVACI